MNCVRGSLRHYRPAGAAFHMAEQLLRDSHRVLLAARPGHFLRQLLPHRLKGIPFPLTPPLSFFVPPPPHSFLSLLLHMNMIGADKYSIDIITREFSLVSKRWNVRNQSTISTSKDIPLNVLRKFHWYHRLQWGSKVSKISWSQSRDINHSHTNTPYISQIRNR